MFIIVTKLNQTHQAMMERVSVPFFLLWLVPSIVTLSTKMQKLSRETNYSLNALLPGIRNKMRSEQHQKWLSHQEKTPNWTIIDLYPRIDPKEKQGISETLWAINIHGYLIRMYQNSRQCFSFILIGY